MVFNVVGEILPAAHIERVLRDYYAGRLGEADLEDRLLKNVDEGQFRAICQNALEGLATKSLNLEMLVERRARVVDGLGQVIHERLFVVEIGEDGQTRIQEPGILGNFTQAGIPPNLPSIGKYPEATA